MQNQEPKEFILSGEAINQIFEIIALQVPTLAGKKIEQQLIKARPYQPPQPPEPKSETEA